MVQEAKSRGAVVDAFLEQSPKEVKDTETFVKKLVDEEGQKGIGGFSLICGKLGEPLAVISNRTPNVEGVTWLAKERSETVGLSNTAFGDRTWPKVLQGERLMASIIAESVACRDSKVDFVESLMGLLSTDTLPKRQESQGLESYVRELRNSIFIPILGGEGTSDTRADDVAAAKTDQQTQSLSRVYGTQKQTVVLVDRACQVTFVERTLYDSSAKPMKSQDRDRWFEFRIED